jgi:hypothetical protein
LALRFCWCNFAIPGPLSHDPVSPDGCTDWVDVNPGSIVQCRSREWVLLPSDQEDLLLLRLLTDAHRRIRQAVSMKVRGLTVRPQLPPDLLGLLVLQPLVQK